MYIRHNNLEVVDMNKTVVLIKQFGTSGVRYIK